MKYIAMKIGSKYVTMNDNGELKLVKGKNSATVWPIELQPQVEEGMDKFIDQGLPVRLVIMEIKGENQYEI